LIIIFFSCGGAFALAVLAPNAQEALAPGCPLFSFFLNEMREISKIALCLAFQVLRVDGIHATRRAFSGVTDGGA
jgi:hypothetical protein